MIWRIVARVTCTLIFFAVVGIRLSAPTPRPVREWQDRLSGISFFLVPAGTFRMGTPAFEPGRAPEELPHQVTFSRMFYIGATEVTQAQWTKVMGGNPSQFQSCGPECPVENVSWHDVLRFIQRLNATDGQGFRLPTEAEWEYSCRAGGTQPFGVTSVLTSQFADIDGSIPYNGPRGGFRRRPLPVAQFGRNPWGLADMSGNVSEWTADDYCPYPQNQVTDPLGACGGSLKVVRGGSWSSSGAAARCGARATRRPGGRDSTVGFRIAHDLF